MVKVIAMFKQPEDKQKFDDHYFNTHVPLTKKIPGLRKMEGTKINGTATGGESKYYLLTEMYYDDYQSMKAAFKTEEAKASGKDAMSFAGDLIEMYIGEEINE
jgi:uncharacterized protein (TIGR02118 family)